VGDCIGFGSVIVLATEAVLELLHLGRLVEAEQQSDDLLCPRKTLLL
jgi:hypothetical protein